MISRQIIGVALLGATVLSCTGGQRDGDAPTPTDRSLRRIAFGSCNDQDLPQPMWAAVMEREPDLWIWLGDNISADTDDPTVMQSRYERQLSRPEYRAVTDSIPIIGTWDDHDFGRNNAGREYPERDASQDLFLDFIGEPRDSPRRTQAGVYTSYEYGPAARSIKVILLDTRYHREAPGDHADPLGERQWEWLERELRESAAQITLLVTSIQLLADEYRGEGWTNFAGARKRLYQLIRASGVRGLIVLSGDRHIGEIAVADSSLVGYPLYEITSSGLTHTWDLAVDVPNRYRVGELVVALNFGEIDVDWNANPVAITMRIRGEDNAVRSEARVPLTALRPDTVED